MGNPLDEQPCASEYDQDSPPIRQKCFLTLWRAHRQSFDPEGLIHTQLQLNSVLGAPLGQGIDDSFCFLSKKQECH